ncbi:MAG: YceD family protein [Syntrophothermus sp.]
MIIKYTNFADGIHDIDFEESAEKIGLDEPFQGDVKLKVRMDKSHSQIVLNCDMEVQADLLCDRCSEEYLATLNKKFKLIYMFGQEPEGDDTPDLYYINTETDKIVLDEDVKDYAILSIPMKNLCSEDCKGLCPHCGADLNKGNCSCVSETINPVWASLQKLKK